SPSRLKAGAAVAAISLAAVKSRASNRRSSVRSVNAMTAKGLVPARTGSTMYESVRYRRRFEPARREQYDRAGTDRSPAQGGARARGGGDANGRRSPHAQHLPRGSGSHQP